MYHNIDIELINKFFRHIVRGTDDDLIHISTRKYTQHSFMEVHDGIVATLKCSNVKYTQHSFMEVHDGVVATLKRSNVKSINVNYPERSPRPVTIDLVRKVLEL